MNALHKELSMSAIGIFNNIFTNEEEFRHQLAVASGYEIISDEEVIKALAAKYAVSKKSIETTIYGPVSVFNRFTFERERVTAHLKIALADYLKKGGYIFSGFITHLIPANITHILKVGVVDEKGRRIHRAVEAGITEHTAKKLIKKNDANSDAWSQFLWGKNINDSSLYDIFIPLEDQSTENIVQLIMENYRKPAVFCTEKSSQAISDMITAAMVEISLLNSGYANEVHCSNDNVKIFVNKSVHLFPRLSDKLKTLAGNTPGVKNVDVVAGKDYRVSIYRDQEFSLPPKVLLVDDEEDFVQTLSERLNSRNYGAHHVFDGEQAMNLLPHDTPDVMVLDLKMPGMQGVEVLKKTKQKKPEVEVIILTGHGSAEDREKCMQLGAFAYLQKPVGIYELSLTIDEAYKKNAANKVANA